MPNWSTMTKKELQSLAKSLRALEKKTGNSKPKNPEELHKWIFDNTGVFVPKVKVCDDHCAPFDFISDVFFEKVTSVVVVGNRGGAKTFNVALLHVALAKFKAGIELCTIGAIEAQAKRAYDHVKTIISKIQNKNKGKSEVKSGTISKTVWTNNSQLEVLAGTMNATNGPHPQVVHFDEVELADQQVFQESRNMSQGAILEGKYFNAVDVITSTRKRSSGPMQKLIDEINNAIKADVEPPYSLYMWCIKETAENMPNCQVANPFVDAKSQCDCDKVVKGFWEDGTNRTLKDICKGDFYKSQGWISHKDIVKLFRQSSKDTWEAQQECLKPSRSGLVYSMFNIKTHGIKSYLPDINNGRIYAGIDFGGTNPFGVVFIQELDYEIEAMSCDGNPVRMSEGSKVVFDEIYIANIGNSRLAELIAERENYWRSVSPGFIVSDRFADPQGKAARIDLSRANPPINTKWTTTRDVVEHLKYTKELFEDQKIFINSARCKMLLEEIESYHYPDKTNVLVDNPEKPVDDFDHALDAMRYCLVNMKSINQRKGKSTSSSMPMSLKNTTNIPRTSSQSLRPADWMKRYKKV